jgi:hypothetical protein
MARKKRPSTLRNLLIVMGLIGATAAMAIGLNFVDRTAPLILPEQFDATFDEARRRHEDNALHTLNPADDLLPDTPDALRDTFGNLIHDLNQESRPMNPVLGNHLGVVFDCAPNEMTAYLLQCEAAAAKMYEALAKPYYLAAEPPHSLARWERLRFTRLGIATMGYGAVLTHNPETARRGLEVLLDTVRLSRMLVREEGGQMQSRGIEEVAMQAITVGTRKPQCAPHLDWLQAELEKLGPPFADRLALLHRFWRKADNTMTYKQSRSELYGFIRRAEILRDTRYRARAWARHRPFLEQLVLQPISKFNHLMHSDPAVKVDLDNDDTKLWFHIGLIIEATRQDLYFQRTLLQVALQRYRQKNAAWPATLDALAPEFIAALPLDPMNNLPFRYSNDGTKAQLYSVGENEADENGGGDDVVLLMLE